MPTYSYVCKSCDHAFDIQQAFTDDALTTCPECGGTLRKVFSAVGVVFKGSGFYRTDSRSSGRKGAEKSGSSENANGTASGSEATKTGTSTEKAGAAAASGSTSPSSSSSSSSGSTSSGSTSSTSSSGSTSSSTGSA